MHAHSPREASCKSAAMVSAVWRAVKLVSIRKESSIGSLSPNKSPKSMDGSSAKSMEKAVFMRARETSAQVTL